MVEFKLTSSILPKHKLRKLCQNLKKINFTNLLTISDISNQKLFIIHTNLLFISNSKKQNCVPIFNPVEISNKQKDRAINIAETYLLIQEKSIQVKDILIRNSFLEILFGEVISKVD